PCPMARFGTAGRKCNSGVVLVLEHRRKRADGYLFYFPARSRRHSGVFVELTYLHSQSDDDPEMQVRVHRCLAVEAPTRSWLRRGQSASCARRLVSYDFKGDVTLSPYPLSGRLSCKRGQALRQLTSVNT